MMESRAHEELPEGRREGTVTDHGITEPRHTAIRKCRAPRTLQCTYLRQES